MAVFLALVITCWLIAFALGSQAGFDNTTTAQAPKSKKPATVATTATSQDTVSPA